MAGLRCPRCGQVFEADPATARCPKCAWAPSRSAAPPVAAPPPAQPAAPTAALPASAGASKLAAWALACALAPVALYAISSILVALSGFRAGGESPWFVPFGGVLSLFALACPVAAIALGIAARRDPRTPQGSRTMALVAIILGSITLGMYVLAVLLVILFIAACAAACGSASSSSHSSCVGSPALLAASPCMAGLTATRPLGKVPWRDALAHHPDLPALRADVFQVAGMRLCVGCFTAYPVFAATLLAAWLWPVPAVAAWTVGPALAALQLVSTAGWTRWRWLKVAVKACLGAGAALVLHAIATAPWPPLAKSLAVAVGGLAAYASAQPRLARIARLQASAP